MLYICPIKSTQRVYTANQHQTKWQSLSIYSALQKLQGEGETKKRDPGHLDQVASAYHLVFGENYQGKSGR